LIKDGRSLETLQQLDTVIFDKTGTLTVEQPKLGRIYPFALYDEETVLTYAAAAEYRQSHPVAKAILSAAQERDLELPTIGDAAYQVGYGIQVTLDDKLIQVGSIRFMQEKGIHLPAETGIVQDQAHATGSSLVYIAVDDHLAGVLRLDPCVRPEAKRIIEYLQAEGKSVLIISGDNKQPTRQLANELGVDGYYAETLPAQKAQLITKLREDGKYVGYIGDGINDAIALKAANVSISLCGASTVATDTAQVILMDGDLARIESLFEISKAFEKNMQANFRNSMIPGVITLSGVFLFHMGLIGALAIYFTSEALSLMNCMMPLIKDEMSDEASWKIKDNAVKEPVDMTPGYLITKNENENENKTEPELVLNTA
jgi:Cu2+-exporting ATPase